MYSASPSAWRASALAWASLSMISTSLSVSLRILVASDSPSAV